MSTLARIAIVAAVTFVFTGSPAFAAEGHQHEAQAASASKQDKCEHGVQKSLCARCNPKLAAVYKAKGDWCAEHERPESQCVLCHPELAKKGVK